MRIYAVADIHGKGSKIKRIQEIITRESPDILVIAGDITRYLSPMKILTQFQNINIPIFGIRGNSDLKCVETHLQNQPNMTLLSHTPVTCLEGLFLGLNGTIPLPFLSKIGFRETLRLKRIEKHITTGTILVVHPPPRGICDKVGNRFSAGSIRLKHFIEKHSPLMVLCGHIHEQAGYQFLKNTLVINCAMNKTFNGAIIDYGNDLPLKVKMVINDK